MPLVKYTSKPPGETTHSIRLAIGEDGGSRRLIFDGDPLDLTADEYYSVLANGYGLEVVNPDSADQKPEALSPVVSPPTQPPAVSSTEPVLSPASDQ